MKAYYHAGLKDIAKASGFRAETLKSSETFSNFKMGGWWVIDVAGWKAYSAILLLLQTTL